MSVSGIIYSKKRPIDSDQLLALYKDAEWAAYTSSPDTLVRAAENSLYVLTAWEDEQLVALLRAVGDGETILYIQDILVLKSHQRQGIGKELMETTLKDFSHIRQILLLTDTMPETTAFYESVGLRNVGEMGATAFIKPVS